MQGHLEEMFLQNSYGEYDKLPGIPKLAKILRLFKSQIKKRL